jgi:hypothetical protein
MTKKNPKISEKIKEKKAQELLLGAQNTSFLTFFLY